MINLDKINKFDLTQFINNFDTAQIPRMVVEQQKFIMMVFVIGSLLIVGGMFKDYHAQEEAVRVRVSQEQGKLVVIDELNSAVEELGDYKSSIPKPMNEVELIVAISKYAHLYNVTIASFKPGDMEDMGLYDIIDVGFTAEPDNFKDMMLFLRKIEKSNLPLRINTWSGATDNEGVLTFLVKLSAVHIHP